MTESNGALSEQGKPVIDLLELMRKDELERLCIKHKDQIEAVRRRNLELKAEVSNV